MWNWSSAYQAPFSFLWSLDRKIFEQVLTLSNTQDTGNKILDLSSSALPNAVHRTEIELISKNITVQFLWYNKRYLHLLEYGFMEESGLCLYDQAITRRYICAVFIQCQITG